MVEEAKKRQGTRCGDYNSAEKKPAEQRVRIHGFRDSCCSGRSALGRRKDKSNLRASAGSVAARGVPSFGACISHNEPAERCMGHQ